MLQEAIAVYHDLLTEAVAQETSAALFSRLRPLNLYFGERPICNVLRPHFYLLDQWDYLRRETEVLLGAFARLHALCQAYPNRRAQLDLEPYEEALFNLDIGQAAPWTTSRLDSFFQPNQNRLNFVEYNAETPAGMGYEDVLTELFMDLPPMQAFVKKYAVQSMPTQGRLLAALLRGYRDWGGQGIPQIAIVDWRHVPTRTEHEIIRQFFEQHGLRTILADPHELEYHDEALWVRDFQVHLVYKRVLCNELIDQMGLDNPLVQAVRQRAVFMTNSFSAKLLAKKSSLAFLSDEQNATLFTPEEQAAIASHIPWTRRITERHTLYQGQTIDLLPFLAGHRKNFVLKPNDEYGGKGIVLGWETSTELWSETLRAALTTPYVVQERVSPIQEDFPAMIDGKLDISSRYVDANPYVFSGHTVHGTLTRLSSGALLNVTAGRGSLVPSFVLQKRGG